MKRERRAYRLTSRIFLMAFFGVLALLILIPLYALLLGTFKGGRRAVRQRPEPGPHT